MGVAREKRQRLTGEQRRLVAENLGLVGVHLRRYGRNLLRGRHDREWADLFQEGCLGLMRAAASYDPGSGIPFAAYALPRIHNAVSRALQVQAAAVAGAGSAQGPAVGGETDDARGRTGGAERGGVRGCAGGGNDGAGRDGAWGSGRGGRSGSRRRVIERPGMARITPTVERRMRARDASDVWDAVGSGETVGDRLRGKYERAVREAAGALAANPRGRRDRPAVIEALVCERWLVPQEEARRPLRQIARDCGCSFSRVARCDQQLSHLLRRVLERDPEFGALRAVAKRDPRGVAAVIDEGLEARLARAGAERFVDRLRKADPRERAGLLVALQEADGAALEESIRHQVFRLNPVARERLFRRIESGERVRSKGLRRSDRHDPARLRRERVESRK